MTSLLPPLAQLWRDNGETDIFSRADLGWLAQQAC